MTLSKDELDAIRARADILTISDQPLHYLIGVKDIPALLIHIAAQEERIGRLEGAASHAVTYLDWYLEWPERGKGLLIEARDKLKALLPTERAGGEQV